MCVCVCVQYYTMLLGNKFRPKYCIRRTEYNAIKRSYKDDYTAITTKRLPGALFYLSTWKPVFFLLLFFPHNIVQNLKFEYILFYPNETSK